MGLPYHWLNQFTFVKFWASQMILVVKNPPANAGDIRDPGSMHRWGRSPGGGHGNPLQYSCLENPMDGGAWWSTFYGVTKSQIWQKQLSPVFTFYTVKHDVTSMYTYLYVHNKLFSHILLPKVCSYGRSQFYIRVEIVLRGFIFFFPCRWLRMGPHFYRW